MMKREEKEGHIKGIAVSRGVLSISHLLFADDSIVFCGATIEECDRVIKVVEDYEGIQGKSSLKRKLPFSLARILIGRSKNKSRRNLMHKLFSIMKNTFDCLHLWEMAKGRRSIVSKTK